MNHFSSHKEQEILLSQFPKNIKLCYEKVIHNKVYESIHNNNNTNQDKIFMAIPKGKKAFFWFYQGKVYVLALSMNQIESIQKVNEIWQEDSLSLLSEFNGSVFYGTLIYISQLKRMYIFQF